MRLGWGSAVVLAGSLGCAGCYCSHERPGDAGVDVGRPDVGDAPRPPRDAGFDGAGCPRIAGFRVCGERCPATCSVEEGRCSRIDVCGQSAGRCNGEFAALNSSDYCQDGHAFCVRTDGDSDTWDPAVRGVCMPADFCRDLPDAGLDEDHCFYSDGTRFVTGPPPLTECPPSPHPRVPFCGGGCTNFCEIGFGDATCAGISDDRPLGVCSSAWFCRSDVELANDFTLDGCEDVFGEPCACVVPRPQSATLRAELGWPVPLSVCRRYTELNPGHAECRDRTWTLIP